MIYISEGLQLKPMVLADQPRLNNLMSEIYPPSYEHLWEDGGAWYLNESYSLTNVRRELLEENAHYFFVVMKGKEIGILRYLLDEPMPGDSTKTVVKLHRIYLAEEAQGKGIARQLVLWVEHQAKKVQAPFVWLDAMDTQKQALRFYEKMGYVICGTGILAFEKLHKHLRGMFYMKKELVPN